MRNRERRRATASLICILFIMICGLTGVFVYKNVINGHARLENTAVSDEELAEFYESSEENDDSWNAEEETGYTAVIDFSTLVRTLTSESVAYDGKTRSIVCWGDSMTEGIGASYASIDIDGESLDISYWTYPDALGYFTGLTTYNYGVSGEDSREIAVRAGGIKLYTDRDVVVGYNHGAAVKVVDEDGEAQYIQNYGGYGNEYGLYYYGAVYIGDELYMLTGSSYDDEEQAYELVDLWLKRYETVTEDVITYSVESAQLSANNDMSSGSSMLETKAFLPTSAEDDDRDAKDRNADNAYPDSDENATEAPWITPQAAMELYGVGYYEEFEHDGDVCVIIPAGTLVTPKAAADHSNDILILEIGSNGGWQGDYTELIKQYDSIIERFNNPYYIIVGDTDDPGDSADPSQGIRDDDGNKMGRSETKWETALREAYGAHFLNTRLYLITNGLKDVGMLTTKRDLRFFSNGMISTKLRADWTHFNSYGYYAQAKAIYLKGVELGYWS